MATRRSIEIDELEVLNANDAFYRAMQSLDAAQMEAVWSHEDWVRCLHPGWELLQGWEAVQESWGHIFNSTMELRVSISRPLVSVFGDTGWISCIEHVTSSFEGDFSTSRVEASNIFVRHRNRWLLVHHHTTPLPDQTFPGTTRSVQ